MKAYVLFKKLEFSVAAVLLCVVLALMGWASISRYLGAPNIWVIEITQLVFAWVCFLAADIAFRRSQHFSIDLLTSILPQSIAPYLSTIRNVILLLILLGLVWISIDFVEIAHRRRLPLTGIRYSWIAASMPLACVLMSINCIDNIIRDLRPRHPEI